MYSWDEDFSDWAKPAGYSYAPEGAEARAKDAAKARAAGPRTYTDRGQPNTQLTDPKKHITSASKNPLIIAVDVTGSMQRWPFEIFDRLPLLFNTLAQYRTDLEVSFAAIGDGAADRWPLQVTEFAKGFTLEDNLKAIYGEGGGGDAPESYGLFAHWVDTHVTVPKAERPFLIIFGDAPMHLRVPAGQIKHFLGDDYDQDVFSIESFNRVASTWNAWFLRRPGGRKGDETEKQWVEALGPQQVVQMDDEQRAVDYAMGLIARTWGHFGDFKKNMSARQDDEKIAELEERLSKVKPRLLVCPSCNAPLPLDAVGRFVCGYCRSTLEL
jgi:hypothetical protein